MKRQYSRLTVAGEVIKIPTAFGGSVLEVEPRGDSYMVGHPGGITITWTSDGAQLQLGGSANLSVDQARDRMSDLQEAIQLVEKIPNVEALIQYGEFGI